LLDILFILTFYFLVQQYLARPRGDQLTPKKVTKF